MNEQTKQCFICKEAKSLGEFTIDSRRKDGRGSYCKNCEIERQIKYRAENKEKLAVQSKRYREENKEKLVERSKEYYKKNRENILEREKKRRERLISLINDLKTSCVICGDERNYVLQFHHRNSKEKKFSIAALSRTKKQILLAEISKCIVLCSNCHSEFHHYKKNHNQISPELLKKYKKLDLKFISN